MITEAYEAGREAAMDWIDRETAARGGYGPWLETASANRRNMPGLPADRGLAAQYRAGWRDAIEEVLLVYRAGRGRCAR